MFIVSLIKGVGDSFTTVVFNVLLFIIYDAFIAETLLIIELLGFNVALFGFVILLDEFCGKILSVVFNVDTY